jgi:hypothetical protein
MRAMPARPDQAIDAGAAAEHLAHRQRRRTAGEACRRFGAERPVALAADIAHPRGGIAHRVDAVVATGLEQQHARGRILGQPPRHHAARGAAAADDEVEVLIGRGSHAGTG